MNKDQLRILRKQMNAALMTIEADSHCKFEIGNITYSDNSAKVTVKVCTQDASGNVYSPEADAFKANAHHYGLVKSDLFREFTMGGVRYKIIGLKTRARKNPILIQDILTDKKFVCGEREVQRILSARSL